MVIKNFGIILEPLIPETAEIIRCWRNNPEINKFMDYKDVISFDQQKQWFEKIQKENSNYFLIKKDDVPIGMIHIEKIDLRDYSAHVGLFIGEADYRGTGVALSASLSLLEYAFERLNLNSLLAKVKNDNTEAIQYNQFLGFEKHKKINDNFSYWILSSERFKLKKDTLLKYITYP